jgi:hypothetical protein
LAKQMYNIIGLLFRIDSGTKHKLSAECRLARGNLQWPGFLDLFIEPKISRFNYFADLKVQSTRCKSDQTGF